MSHTSSGPQRLASVRGHPDTDVLMQTSMAEDDRDYHLALEDPDAPGSTVVTELADTVCQGAWMSPHLATLRSVEGMFASMLGDDLPRHWWER